MKFQMNPGDTQKPQLRGHAKGSAGAEPSPAGAPKHGQYQQSRGWYSKTPIGCEYQPFCLLVRASTRPNAAGHRDLPQSDLPTYIAEPGSPSEEALRLLASWVASQHTESATPQLLSTGGIVRRPLRCM